jgi:hypothetical protein
MQGAQRDAHAPGSAYAQLAHAPPGSVAASSSAMVRPQ